MDPAPTTTPLGRNGLVSTPRLVDRGDLVFLAYLLLPFGLFLQLGRLAGWTEMILRPRARRGVRANLQRAFGASKSARELDRLTRQVFEGHQTRILLVAAVPLLVADGTLESEFPIEGLEHLDRAIAAGKGALILGSHVNSIGGLLAMVRLRKLGYDVRVPMPDPVDAWPLTLFRRAVHRVLKLQSVSELLGALYVQFNVRPLMRLLDQGSIVLLMGDGWHSASFVDAEFLGRRLPFTNGPLSVARLAGVPVVQMFALGRPDKLRFELEPAFTVEKSADSVADIEVAVRRYVARVEARMLETIPSWQHWMVEDLFGSLERWRSLPLHERYHV